MIVGVANWMHKLTVYIQPESQGRFDPSTWYTVSFSGFNFRIVEERNPSAAQLPGLVLLTNKERGLIVCAPPTSLPYFTRVYVPLDNTFRGTLPDVLPVYEPNSGRVVVRRARPVHCPAIGHAALQARHAEEKRLVATARRLMNRRHAGDRDPAIMPPVI